MRQCIYLLSSGELSVFVRIADEGRSDQDTAFTKNIYLRSPGGNAGHSHESRLISIADPWRGEQPNQVARRKGLLLVLDPTALPALTFEDADRPASSGVHDFADQSWLSAAPAFEFAAHF
jgi:hypothetical protein